MITITTMMIIMIMLVLAGHPFFVDLCGRPTEVNKCAECGAKIGGKYQTLPVVA